MHADEILSQAMRGATQMIGGQDMWVVEGNSATNDIRITPFETAFPFNHWCFAEGRPMPYLFLGLCSSKEAAEELALKIRTLVRNEEGKNLLQ